MPLPLLVKYFPLHMGYLLLAFMFHLVRGKGGVFLRSKIEVLRNIRLTLQKRKAVQIKRRISIHSLDRMINRQSLFNHIIHRV
jgi:hypothetical protein